MSLIQIIYQSIPLVPFEGAELAALLQHQQDNNRRNGISGVLLYTPDGRFLQVLEGERDTCARTTPNELPTTNATTTASY